MRITDRDILLNSRKLEYQPDGAVPVEFLLVVVVEEYDCLQLNCCCWDDGPTKF